MSFGYVIALAILVTIGAFVLEGFRAQLARTNELLREIADHLAAIRGFRN